MMQRSRGGHHIRFVEDGVLPDDQAFTFMECEGEVWLVYNQAKITPTVLEESWMVYREAVGA